jgi:hypothetical protein
MNLMETGWQGVDRIRDKGWALVNTVMNFCVP